MSLVLRYSLLFNFKMYIFTGTYLYYFNHGYITETKKCKKLRFYSVHVDLATQFYSWYGQIATWRPRKPKVNLLAYIPLRVFKINRTGEKKNFVLVWVSTAAQTRLKARLGLAVDSPEITRSQPDLTRDTRLIHWQSAGAIAAKIFTYRDFCCKIVPIYTASVPIKA